MPPDYVVSKDSGQSVLHDSAETPELTAD